MALNLLGKASANEREVLALLVTLREASKAMVRLGIVRW